MTNYCSSWTSLLGVLGVFVEDLGADPILRVLPRLAACRSCKALARQCIAMSHSVSESSKDFGQVAVCTEGAN